jgi:hypothetical protein
MTVENQSATWSVNARAELRTKSSIGDATAVWKLTWSAPASLKRKHFKRLKQRRFSPPKNVKPLTNGCKTLRN